MATTTYDDPSDGCFTGPFMGNRVTFAHEPWTKDGKYCCARCGRTLTAPRRQT